MSKKKYTIGKPIRTVAEFERSDSKFYIVFFGMTTAKTLHRSFLESWQYHTLKLFCDRGNVYTAERIEDE